jgi:HEAT repeat protein
VLERAISAIGGRWGAASVPQLVPLAKNAAGNASSDTRIAALHALAACGGPEALATVRAATNDADAVVQDEAVRTLSTWPNRWPEDAAAAEPLLELARSAAKPAHRVLGVRGYLQYVQGDKKLPAAKRVELVKTILPLVTRPDEKRLAIATLGGIPSDAALQELTTLAADPALSEDACAAILRIATRSDPDVATAARRSALQTVIEKSRTPRAKDRARNAIKELPND